MSIRKLVVPVILVAGVSALAVSKMHGSGCMLCDGLTMVGLLESTANAEPTPAAAPAVTLKVGDKAPELKVDKWVKGEEVSSLAPGKVYVVEFWATWCGPCRRAIPHMTELQKKHKDDATFIGVAASERKDEDGSDKRVEKLEAFVKKQGDDMGYRVAYDSDREAAVAWMKAAGVNSIPTAYVINASGTIAWIGNPNDNEFEQSLEAAIKAAKKN